MACNYSCTGISTNDASTQELSYEFGAISAEAAGGGVRVNIIPKEGGNRFSGSGFVNYANDSLQGNNIDDDAASARASRPATASCGSTTRASPFGGPLKQDKLWFWTAHRLLGLRADPDEHVLREEPVRLRLRSRSEPARHRVAAQRQRRPAPDVADQPAATSCRATSTSRRATPTTGRWAARFSPTPRTCRTCRSNHFETFTFRSTLTSKALFEAAMGNTSETWTREPVEDSETSKGYPVTEQTTGINFRAYTGNFSHNYTSLRSYRSSLTYVHRLARAQVRLHAAGRPGRHRRLHEQGHVAHRPASASRSR